VFNFTILLHDIDILNFRTLQNEELLLFVHSEFGDFLIKKKLEFLRKIWAGKPGASLSKFMGWPQYYAFPAHIFLKRTIIYRFFEENMGCETTPRYLNARGGGP